MQRCLLSNRCCAWLLKQSEELAETEKKGAHPELHGPQKTATTKRRWGFMVHAAGASVSFAKATASSFLIGMIKQNIES